MAAVHRPPRGAGFAPVLAAQAYAQRVALVGLVGNENAGQLWQAYAWIGPVVAIMVLAVLIVVPVVLVPAIVIKTLDDRPVRFPREPGGR